MSDVITCYRIFLASPSGLDAERETVRKAVDTFNRHTALRFGMLFLVIGWEDVPGGYGRPQDMINVSLDVCDYFMMLLWHQWGSEPGLATFSSGTEEEFTRANNCLLEEWLVEKVREGAGDKRLPLRIRKRTLVARKFQLSNRSCGFREIGGLNEGGMLAGRFLGGLGLLAF